MQAWKKRIWFITILLIGVVLICAQMLTETGNDMPLYAEVLLDEKTEIVQLFEDGNGEFYFFLPSCAELSSTRLRLHTTVSIQIDGQTISDNMDCDAFQPGERYELTYTAWGKQRCSSLTFLKSANIASVYVDTESGTMDYIHKEKGNKESGVIRIYDAEGNKDYAGALSFIKGRGNATWIEYEKKPYSLKLEESAEILGMGAAQKWILLANAGDASMIRNKIVYSFAEELGMAYTADSRWVDLYLNGEYAGLYQLIERNEVHSERVDIGQDGSFLLSLELENKLEAQNYPYVLTEAKQALRVHYPEAPTKVELKTIAKTMQSVENALLSEDGNDPISGKHWTELIDMDSWVNKYLIEEIFGNGDAGAISQFFYYDGKNPEEKIYAGPVWDYDRTMANPDVWHLQEPQTFFANRLNVDDGYDTPWLHSLYRKDAFYEQIVERYQNCCLPLLEELLTEKIRDYAEEISQSSVMDHNRWQLDTTRIQEEIDNIVSYMSQRIEFLNRVWLDGETYYEVQADQGFGSHYAHYVVFSGETLPTLYEFEDSAYSVFLGWYDVDTDEPVDISRPITEDMKIYAKWKDSSYKQMNQIIKLIPFGLIAILGVTIVWIDMKRMKSR